MPGANLLCALHCICVNFRDIKVQCRGQIVLPGANSINRIDPWWSDPACFNVSWDSITSKTYYVAFIIKKDKAGAIWGQQLGGEGEEGKRYQKILNWQNALGKSRLAFECNAQLRPLLILQMCSDPKFIRSIN